ncbi:MAG: HAD-IIA family hydrolase [Lachnospiraceae bacterium]|nr:HAD-IIA family hydrolase [Lachnospiraceae bacterium]
MPGRPALCAEDKAKAVKDVKLFVLDMDGTFYLGDRLIEGSLEFLQRVKETGRRFVFFTNNSSRIPSVYQQKLARMGCNVEQREVITSGEVTIAYLRTHYPGKRVYLVGTPLLTESFREAGICLVEEAPDLVVVGFDMTLTYEKLERACTFIRNGAVFLATHLDINCPTEDGFIPDCGAMCALITKSTGVEPRYLGKPFAETVEMVLELTGSRREEIAFVGDRLYTDVATGVKNGAKGFLVLTGEATLADVETGEVQPTCIYDSLFDISRYL